MSNNKTRASFTIQHRGSVVALVDNAPLTATMSVTNDAENVVRFLYEEGVIVGSMPVVYRDTEGRWDGLAHDGHGHFTGFVPLSASTMEDAIVQMWDKTMGRRRVADVIRGTDNG